MPRASSDRIQFDVPPLISASTSTSTSTSDRDRPRKKARGKNRDESALASPATLARIIQPIVPYERLHDRGWLAKMGFSILPARETEGEWYELVTTFERRYGCSNCVARHVACSVDRDKFRLRYVHDSDTRAAYVYAGQCRHCEEDGLYCPMMGFQKVRRRLDEDRPPGSLDFYEMLNLSDTVAMDVNMLAYADQADVAAIRYYRSTFPETQLVKVDTCVDMQHWLSLIENYVPDVPASRRIIGRANHTYKDGDETVHDIFYLVTANIGPSSRTVPGSVPAVKRPGSIDTAFWIRATKVGSSCDDYLEVAAPTRVSKLSYHEQSYAVAMGLQGVGIDHDEASGISLIATNPRVWEFFNTYKLRLAIAKRASWDTPSQVDDAIRLQHPDFTTIPACAWRESPSGPDPSIGEDVEVERERLGRIVAKALVDGPKTHPDTIFEVCYLARDDGRLHWVFERGAPEDYEGWLHFQHMAFDVQGPPPPVYRNIGHYRIAATFAHGWIEDADVEGMNEIGWLDRLAQVYDSHPEWVDLIDSSVNEEAVEEEEGDGTGDYNDDGYHDEDAEGETASSAAGEILHSPSSPLSPLDDAVETQEPPASDDRQQHFTESADDGGRPGDGVHRRKRHRVSDTGNESAAPSPVTNSNTKRNGSLTKVLAPREDQEGRAGVKAGPRSSAASASSSGKKRTSRLGPEEDQEKGSSGIANGVDDGAGTPIKHQARAKLAESHDHNVGAATIAVSNGKGNCSDIPNANRAQLAVEEQRVQRRVSTPATPINGSGGRSWLARDEVQSMMSRIGAARRANVARSALQANATPKPGRARRREGQEDASSASPASAARVRGQRRGTPEDTSSPSRPQPAAAAARSRSTTAPVVVDPTNIPVVPSSAADIDQLEGWVGLSENPHGIIGRASRLVHVKGEQWDELFSLVTRPPQPSINVATVSHPSGSGAYWVLANRVRIRDGNSAMFMKPAMQATAGVTLAEASLCGPLSAVEQDRAEAMALFILGIDIDASGIVAISSDPQYRPHFHVYRARWAMALQHDWQTDQDADAAVADQHPAIPTPSSSASLASINKHFPQGRPRQATEVLGQALFAVWRGRDLKLPIYSLCRVQSDPHLAIWIPDRTAPQGAAAFRYNCFNLAAPSAPIFRTKGNRKTSATFAHDWWSGPSSTGAGGRSVGASDTDDERGAKVLMDLRDCADEHDAREFAIRQLFRTFELEERIEARIKLEKATRDEVYRALKQLPRGR